MVLQCIVVGAINAEAVVMQKLGTDFAIDGNSGTVQDKQQVYLWDTNIQNINQQWVEISRGNNYYSYQKINTTLCLDGGNGGARVQPVVLWACGDSNYNQHWQKVSTGGNAFRLEKRNAPEFSIDGNRGGNQGQGIYLWDSNSGNVNQQWEFFVADDGVEGPPDRSSWILNASNNQADVYNAIDNSASTRWTTNTAQTSGQWLTIDLGRDSSFDTISLVADASPNDYPRGYAVYVSNDGSNWGSPIATGSGNDATTDITFSDVSAKYIRVEQTGSDDRLWWSIHELLVTKDTIVDPSCIEISSLNELKSYTDDSNVCVQMRPGTYRFTTDNAGEGKLFSDPTLLLFTGSNNTFVFEDVKFEYDTDIFREFGSVEVIEFQVVGNDNVFLNLTMEDIGNTVPLRTALAISIDGEDNRLEGFDVTTRGSYPYGYGDIFGKGGGPVIGHRKHGAVQFRGNRNHLKDCRLILRSYGHGIFIQGAEDARVEGCYVEGELRTTDDVLAERGTGSPADNVDFMTVWGFQLQPGYTFSLQEDGIRAYTTGLIYGTDESRNTGDVTVIDSTVKFMRSGVTIGWASGTKYVENCTALGTESGFWVGSNARVVNSRGDASVGPLFSEDRTGNGSNVELTILDNVIPKFGNTPSLYLAGDNHNFTLKDGTTSFDPEVEILVGGTRLGHRWLAGTDEEPPFFGALDLTINNETQYPIVLGTNTSGNELNSCGPVRDDGSNNDVNC